jgi:hypothetical protein
MIYKIFYDKMGGDGNGNEFVELPINPFPDILLPAMNSDFEKINNTSPREIITRDDEGGDVFPDFFYDGAIPLFSEKIFYAMNNVGLRDVLKINVEIIDEIDEISKPYVLIIPSRIQIFNSMGIIDNEEYNIFKNADNIYDTNIYISGMLKKVFDEYKPLGMKILPYEEELIRR